MAFSIGIHNGLHPCTGNELQGSGRSDWSAVHLLRSGDQTATYHAATALPQHTEDIHNTTSQQAAPCLLRSVSSKVTLSKLLMNFFLSNIFSYKKDAM